MHQISTFVQTDSPAQSPQSGGPSVTEVLDWLRHYLPHQGTLQYFVHHNPLQAFEHYPFEAALRIAGQAYQGRCLLEQERYLNYMQQGKISFQALQDQLQSHILQYQLQGMVEQYGFDSFLRLLQEPPQLTVRQNILKQFFKERDRSLITEIETWIAQTVIPEQQANPYLFPTHRELILQQRGIDIDEQINPLMAKFFSSYADPGSAYWVNEYKQQGLWNCFKEHYASSFILESMLARRVHQEIKQTRIQSDSCKNLIAYYLRKLGVPVDAWKPYLLALALRLRGWAALFNQLEHEPFQVLDQTVFSLQEFILVKLVFEAVVVYSCLPDAGRQELQQFFQLQKRQQILEQNTELHYLTLYFLQINQKSSPEHWPVTQSQKQQLISGLCYFLKPYRQMIYQNALEKTYAYQCLEAFCKVNHRPENSPLCPSFQYITCIDDREESLRRYLEQVDPHCQTFGITGHFEMNMEYKGFNEVRFRKLCPGVIDETFRVIQVMPQKQKTHLSRGYAQVVKTYSLHSKISFFSYLITLLSGYLSALPFFIKVFFPQWDQSIRRELKRRLLHRQELQDQVFHEQQNPQGISYEQGADKVWQLLRTIDLTEHFSEFVYVVGHGSSSINNPHEYAYNCGACGGGKGRPNGRIFALVANHAQVRQFLKSKYQLAIPDTTIFVGGYHDTCKDHITWFDSHLTTEQKRRHAVHAAKIQSALVLNARERARKFFNISPQLNPASIYRKVASRSNDLTEARPEYNHATNALCIIGKRAFTRHLFLDRRAFLCSYNPAHDDDGSILARIMEAAVPVCAGINLEYYFSTMDPEVFGCGSKLNHNITNNYAVMSGFASDLRLGLSRQMVEIHDPKRILILIDSKPEIVLRIMEKNQRLMNLISNQWVHLMVHDFESKKFYQYQPSGFVPLKEIASHLRIYQRSEQIAVDAQNLIPIAILENTEHE